MRYGHYFVFGLAWPSAPDSATQQATFHIVNVKPVYLRLFIGMLSQVIETIPNQKPNL
jgi:hypothetical protein